MSAVEPATTTANVSAIVAGTLAIGNESGNFEENALNVDISLKANDKQEEAIVVRTINNTGTNGTLELKATNSASLAGEGNAVGESIPASGKEPSAGTAGWGFKGADGVYHEPTTESGATVSTGDLQGDQQTNVTFIVATDTGQMNGTYSTGVTYTFTAN